MIQQKYAVKYFIVGLQYTAIKIKIFIFIPILS